MENAQSGIDECVSVSKHEGTIPLITEIQRFCLQDGPGIRTTIFMKGCPLRCPWCHNPETQNRKREIYFYSDKCTGCGRCVEVCPTGASSILIVSGKQPLSRIDRRKCIGCLKCVENCLVEARGVVGRHFTIDEIRIESTSDLPFYARSGGGVTLSGGDPLFFPEFSLLLASRLRKEGVHVGMETSCFARWKVIESLMSFIDLFLVDIKSMNPEKHEKVVGWPLKPILDNIRNLIEADANVRIHLPIIPGFNDSVDDFEAWAEFLAPFADRLTGVDILPYHVYGERKYEFLGRDEDYQYKGIKEIAPEVLVALAEALIRAGITQVTVGGMVGMGTERGLKPNRRTGGEDLE